MVTARSGGKLHVLAGAHHFRFDNSLAPALAVESGDTVVFECLEAYGGELGPGSTVNDLKRLPFDAVHCLTGPVAVAGAEPGDALEVQVLEITASQWAWTGVFPGCGALPNPAYPLQPMQNVITDRPIAPGVAALIPALLALVPHENWP